jgi:hypothetical protein
VRVKQHHFVSIISFLRGWIPFAVGRDSAGKWGAVPEHVGHDSAAVGQPESRCPVESGSDHLGRWFCGNGLRSRRRAPGLYPVLFHFLHSAAYMVPVAGRDLGLAQE